MSLRDDFEEWAREFTSLDLDWMEDEGGYQFQDTDHAFMAYQAATERAVRIVQVLLPTDGHARFAEVVRRLKDES